LNRGATAIPIFLRVYAHGRQKHQVDFGPKRVMPTRGRVVGGRLSGRGGPGSPTSTGPLLFPEWETGGGGRKRCAGGPIPSFVAENCFFVWPRARGGHCRKGGAGACRLEPTNMDQKPPPSLRSIFPIRGTKEKKGGGPRPIPGRGQTPGGHKAGPENRKEGRGLYKPGGHIHQTRAETTGNWSGPQGGRGGGAHKGETCPAFRDHVIRRLIRRRPWDLNRARGRAGLTSALGGPDISRPGPSFFFFKGRKKKPRVGEGPRRVQTRGFSTPPTPPTAISSFSTPTGLAQGGGGMFRGSSC